MGKWVLVLVLVSPGLLGGAQGLVAQCPKAGSNIPSYCTCSSTSVTIRCDFQNQEEVMLTSDLLAPYGNISISSTYVRVANATSLLVRSDFMVTWLKAPSSAFDIWHCGEITLQSTPSPANNTRVKSGTFAGVGIVNCSIPELPPNFLRDRTRGTLRVKQSKIGVLRAGFFNNVQEMRYIVLHDSDVEEVEGSVTTEGFVTLSQRDVHTWNGLLLSNVTIGTLGPGAFNLTHKSDMEVMTVKDCLVGRIAPGALAARGDIEVTITGNNFLELEKGAFKINVTGSVNFNQNIMKAQGLEALAEMSCHNASSIQNNTILVSKPVRPVSGKSSTPFHPSCGKPQLFMVLTPARQVLVMEDTRVAWVLGATLAVLGMVMVLGVAWFFRRRRPVWTPGRFSGTFMGRNRKTSLENLPRNIELNSTREDLEAGTSVKDLDMTCEPQQENEQPLLDEGSGDQSTQSFDD
ncbi:uncharacterized protein LOC135103578 [Scylla paramamosain]|uniref:uncharacterized protein LOC135103578 n=1 Tax=Scylla paramamosain TaxID=85552 RepID=UPI0030836357